MIQLSLHYVAIGKTNVSEICISGFNHILSLNIPPPNSDIAVLPIVIFLLIYLV
jgi:hypothetical protein